MLLALSVAPVSGAASSSASGVALPTRAYRDDRILILPKAEARGPALAGFLETNGFKVLATFADLGELQVVLLPVGATVPDAVDVCRRSGLLTFAEPDHARELHLAPNDPSYVNGTLWGLHNTGQNAGTSDADIDAPEAWDVLSSASNIVVATLDTGVRRTHEDLAANIRTNAAGYGWNALAGTHTPVDDEGHGTLVAGVLGAVGNNGKGIAGVAWRAQILAGKCFNAQRIGFDSDIIACIEYARTNGARIINASLGSTNYSQALSNALFNARQGGILVVASAGNDAVNIDSRPQYPACYNLDNIVSVGASTRNDTLYSLSNFGATNVDLVAPGHQITSTFFISDSFYLSASGTSMAAPHVTGALALLLARYPTETHQQIIRRLLDGADPKPAFAGKCATGSRLNLRHALSSPIRLTLLSSSPSAPLQVQVAAGPNRTCVIEVSSNFTNWIPVLTNATSANGTFAFADPAFPGGSRRFYRAVAAL